MGLGVGVAGHNCPAEEKPPFADTHPDFAVVERNIQGYADAVDVGSS